MEISAIVITEVSGKMWFVAICFPANIWGPNFLAKMRYSLLSLLLVCLQEEKQKYHSHLLMRNIEKDLEAERQTVTRLSFELNEFQRKYEETKKENLDLSNLLSSLRKADVKYMEDNKYKTEKIQKLKKENEIVREKLEEEKKRSEDLLSQVSPLPVRFHDLHSVCV